MLGFFSTGKKQYLLHRWAFLFIHCFVILAELEFCSSFQRIIRWWNYIIHLLVLGCWRNYPWVFHGSCCGFHSHAISFSFLVIGRQLSVGECNLSPLSCSSDCPKHLSHFVSRKYNKYCLWREKKKCLFPWPVIKTFSHWMPRKIYPAQTNIVFFNWQVPVNSISSPWEFVHALINNPV